MEILITILKWMLTILLILGLITVLSHFGSGKSAADDDPMEDGWNVREGNDRQHADAPTDNADNPYTDDDDYSFREPAWNQAENRYRDEGPGGHPNSPGPGHSNSPTLTLA